MLAKLRDIEARCDRINFPNPRQWWGFGLQIPLAIPWQKRWIWQPNPYVAYSLISLPTNIGDRL
jgi:hypothetical protein